MSKFDKSINILLYLLNSLEEERDVIGKTVIQKLFYLLYRERKINLDYTLYHYGPFSQELSNILDFADSSEFIEINWKSNGYDIKAKKEPSVDLDPETKSAIKEIINKYGSLKPNDLSIIATGYYLKDEYLVEDDILAKAGNCIKPQFEINDINSILKSAGVLN